VSVEAVTDTIDGLLPIERELVPGAVPSRLGEFAAGRRAAREVLAAYGLRHAPVLRDANGAPRWPAGIVGSISHSGGIAAAIGSRVSAIAASWGLDIEKHQSLEESSWDQILTARELAALTGLPANVRGWAALAVFCAKESVYKCQYPLTGTFLEFGDVEIDFAAASPCFRATVLKPVSVYEGQLVLPGRWGFANGLIASVVCAPGFNPTFTLHR
jgi:4'-phosphopantetheinyl transferase EntD